MSIFLKKRYDINMRNVQKDALILSVKPYGENNRIVTFLTNEDGILSAILYGGPKSRLRSRVSMFNSGKIYLYNDESKHSSKITDFDVKKYHLSFRENLFKIWAANLAIEIVILTKSAGSPEEVFTMLNGFLDGLDFISDEKNALAGLIRFLWRYLGLLGVQPDAFCCNSCHKAFFCGNLNYNTVEYKSGGAFYSHSENGFICTDCYKNYFEHSVLQIIPELSSKSVVYLYAASVCEPSVSRNMKLSEQELDSLKGFVFSLLESAVGTKIKTLHSGIGII